MREWLRLLAQKGLDPAAARSRGWMDAPARALNTWRRRDDFSHEVKAAMDGCLACKSCVGQCPIKVDVPAFRSRFLDAYYGRYLRPARDHLVARLEAMLPLMARAPRLVNALMQSRLGRSATRRLGLVALPELASDSLLAHLKERGVMMATPEALQAVPQAERRLNVVVVQDAFTTHYEPRLVLDLIELLQRLGFRPWLAPFRPNGKPQHVLGMLAAFRRTATRNAGMLAELAATGVGLVGVDPSMTLAYRAEYAKALGKEAVPTIHLAQEWLAQRLDDLPQLCPGLAASWALLPHCTERTNAPAATADWVTVARRLGVDLQVVASGCCGMAGLYGHERANRSSSETIYGLSWGPLLADPRHAGRTVATGYSCRCQAKMIDGVHLTHPLQLLLGAVKAAKASQAAHAGGDDSLLQEHHEEY
jgi:Fe-S oxidoreductase